MRRQVIQHAAGVLLCYRQSFTAATGVATGCCSPSLPISMRFLNQAGHQAFTKPATDQHKITLEGKQSNKSEQLWNIPNSLSIGRGLSGPFIAYLIIQEQWSMAIPAIAISGATDWLDGYMARRMGLQSVLGSYLDPLGDKLLICSVVSALAVKSLVPLWVASVIVGRDVALVSGMVLHRYSSLSWRRVSLQEFLKTRKIQVPPDTQQDPGSTADSGSQEDKGVPLMRPLMISKVNTVLQLTLVSGCLSQAWVQWPDAESLHVLELATAATTGISCLAYGQKYMAGKLL